MLRDERLSHEREYEGNGEGCYIYEVQHPRTGKWVCLDATRAFGTVGRLVNHGRPNANLRSMAAVVDDILRVGFLASKDVTSGEEVHFDYGYQTKAPLWMRTKPQNPPPSTVQNVCSTD